MAQCLHATGPIPNKALRAGTVPGETHGGGSVAAHAIAATPFPIQSATIRRVPHVCPAGGLTTDRWVDVSVGTRARRNNGRTVLRNIYRGAQKVAGIEEGETTTGKFGTVRA